MSEEQLRQIENVFYRAFCWMDASDMYKLYKKMKDAIMEDIIENADTDFNDSDVRIAIHRVLLREFKIID